jgi:hypothetical protein
MVGTDRLEPQSLHDWRGSHCLEFTAHYEGKFGVFW